MTLFDLICRVLLLDEFRVPRYLNPLLSSTSAVDSKRSCSEPNVTPMRPRKRNTQTFTVPVRSIPNVKGQLRSMLANKTGRISFSNSKPKRGYFHWSEIKHQQTSVVLSSTWSKRPVSIYNSNTISCGQFRNWDRPFHAIRFPNKIYTTEAALYDRIPFHVLDLRNVSRLVKTKTKTRVQCLIMVNTGSLGKSICVIHVVPTAIPFVE